MLARQDSKRYQGYLVEVANGINGVGSFDLEPPWMAHGKAWEDEARAMYEWKTGRSARQVGFIKHGDLPYIGASPDGLVDDGCIEIKSRKSFESHIACVDKLPSEHVAQVQGEMWVCGCEWNDFVSFWKSPFSSALIVVRVSRRDDIVKKLERCCPEFYEKASELAVKLKFKRRV